MATMGFRSGPGLRRASAPVTAAISLARTRRQAFSSSPPISPGRSDARPVSGRTVCLDVPGVETGPCKDISRCLAPHWTKVQYLSRFNSHKFHIIFSDRSLSTEKNFESLQVHSPRLAAVAVIPADPGPARRTRLWQAGRGPGQAPESRETDWIPPYRVRGRLCQARNDIRYPAA